MMTRVQLVMFCQTSAIAIGAAIDVYLKRRIIQKLDGIIAKLDAKARVDQAKG